MQEIYNTTTSAMRAYMYPKNTVILNVAPVKEEQPSVENDAAASNVEEMVIAESEVIKELTNPKELRKSDLIDYIKSIHGEDADVSGTKAEIIERYFQ